MHTFTHSFMNMYFIIYVFVNIYRSHTVVLILLVLFTTFQLLYTPEFFRHLFIVINFKGI